MTLLEKVKKTFLKEKIEKKGFIEVLEMIKKEKLFNGTTGENIDIFFQYLKDNNIEVSKGEIYKVIFEDGNNKEVAI